MDGSKVKVMTADQTKCSQKVEVSVTDAVEFYFVSNNFSTL